MGDIMQFLSSYTTTPKAIASLSGERRLVIRSPYPTDNDFDQTDFSSQDNAFHTFDVSSIVPSDAVAVLFNFALKDAQADSHMSIRGVGAGVFMMSQIRTQVANVAIRAIGWCTYDGSGNLEYRINEAITSCNFTIYGWWT